MRRPLTPSNPDWGLLEPLFGGYWGPLGPGRVPGGPSDVFVAVPSFRLLVTALLKLPTDLQRGKESTARNSNILSVRNPPEALQAHSMNHFKAYVI